MMEDGEQIFDDTYEILLARRQQGEIDEQEVTDMTKKFGTLLGVLDTIFSTVQGKQKGLLPTQENIQFLGDAIRKGKELWLDLSLTTLQPKWHLTFDGHLLDQVTHMHGIADKGEDPIEKAHQDWRVMYERFCRIPSFERGERCIRRAWKRAFQTIVP